MKHRWRHRIPVTLTQITQPLFFHCFQFSAIRPRTSKEKTTFYAWRNVAHEHTQFSLCMTSDQSFVSCKKDWSFYASAARSIILGDLSSFDCTWACWWPEPVYNTNLQRALLSPVCLPIWVLFDIWRVTIWLKSPLILELLSTSHTVNLLELKNSCQKSFSLLVGRLCDCFVGRYVKSVYTSTCHNKQLQDLNLIACINRKRNNKTR